MLSAIFFIIFACKGFHSLSKWKCKPFHFAVR
jgi:hypothetical protein